MIEPATHRCYICEQEKPDCVERNEDWACPSCIKDVTDPRWNILIRAGLRELAKGKMYGKRRRK